MVLLPTENGDLKSGLKSVYASLWGVEEVCCSLCS